MTISTSEILKNSREFRIYSIESREPEWSGNKEWQAFLEQLLLWEKEERLVRSMKASLSKSRLSKYSQPTGLKDFDWGWPTKINRSELEDLFQLAFLKEKENVVLVGPNGVGKTTLLKNLVQESIKSGHSALFIEASELLDDLGSYDSPTGLRRRIEHYSKPHLLGIDEIGYLSYNTKHADLLFQIVHRRSGRGSTAITTNRSFGEWPELFPNATSVTALVDRLIEKCTVIQIEGPTYRGRMYKENQKRKQEQRGNA